MDPNWPTNPTHSLICVLCKSAVPYINGDSEQMSRHLMMDHCVYFNINLVVELSRVQPTRDVTNYFQDVALQVLNEMTPPSTPEEDNVNNSITVKKEMLESTIENESNTLLVDDVTLEETCFVERDQGDTIMDIDLDFDLGLLNNHADQGNAGSGKSNTSNTYLQKSNTSNAYLQKSNTSTSHLQKNNTSTSHLQKNNTPNSPVMNSNKSNAYLHKSNTVNTSFQRINTSKTFLQTQVKTEVSAKINTTNTYLPTQARSEPIMQLSRVTNPSTNNEDDFSHLDPISFAAPVVPPLIPEDLQSLIIRTNVTKKINFTSTQMIVDQFILRKAGGPYVSQGARMTNWRCVEITCQFAAVTWEGQIMDIGQHNHSAKPEVDIKKEVKETRIVQSKFDMEIKPSNDLKNNENTRSDQIWFPGDLIRETARNIKIEN